MLEKSHLKPNSLKKQRISEVDTVLARVARSKKIIKDKLGHKQFQKDQILKMKKAK